MEQGFLTEAPVFSDVKSFNGRPWRGLVDGVIGGIPCQGHSLAGKKLGSLDERDLWSPTRRIVVQSRPCFVLIENVTGMLHPGADEIAGAERVWRDLRKLGYSVEGGLFTAAEVGASHQRERVFILGVANDAMRGWGDVSATGWCERFEGPHRGCRGDVADAASGRYREGREQRDIHSAHGGSDGELLRESSSTVEQLANANGERLERQRADSGEIGREDARRPSRLCDGATLVHTECPEWRQGTVGGDEPNRDDAGRDQAASRIGEPSEAVGDTAREGRRPISVQPRRQIEASPNLDWSIDELEHAESNGRREGWPEPTIRSGRNAAGSAVGSMANADFSEFRGEPSAGEFAIVQQDDGHGGVFGQECVANAYCDEQAAQRRDTGEVQDEAQGEGRTEYSSSLFGGCGFTPFPPGPGDIEGWRYILERAPHLEPAVRGMADGLGSTRIDWLRLLGNGVVPLQAAYAFRVLATRLAARGSAYANVLVRMMETE